MGTAFAAALRTPYVAQNVPFTGIGAGNIANAILPVGQTYLASLLYFSVAGTAATRAQINSDVEYIQLLLNGVEVANLSGNFWATLAEFYRSGIVGATGYLPLNFERQYMQELAVQRSFAWGTAKQSSFQINVKLAAGAVIDAITLCHRIDPRVEVLGRHVEYRQMSHTFGSTGQDRIIDLPHADYSAQPDSLAALHLVVTKANISNLIIRADKSELWNGTVGQLEKFYKFASDARTPQSTMLSLDFLNRNWLADQLPLSMDTLEVIPTWTSSPGTYQMIMEVMTGTPGEIKG